jgi:hypothetical protein
LITTEGLNFYKITKEVLLIIILKAMGYIVGSMANAIMENGKRAKWMALANFTGPRESYIEENMRKT